MKNIFTIIIIVCSLNSLAQNGVWTKKADFGGINRSVAVGFSIGNKGYIGTGYNTGGLNDFWEWDQATNTWTQKADLAGAKRIGAVGFSIGTKGYIGTASGNNPDDFWEFDPNGNGIYENEFSSSISLSPNPATNTLSVQSLKFKVQDWEVVNILGETMKRQTLNQEHGTFNIDISAFPAGVYYLKVSSEGNSAVKKFIKM